MTTIISREIQLASRPNGLPTAANFSLVQHKLAPLPAGRFPAAHTNQLTLFPQQV